MSKKSFSLGLLVGVVTGTLTALLLAPKSGKELREDIKHTSEDIYGKTAPIREKSCELASKAKQASINMKDIVVEKCSKIKNPANSTENHDIAQTTIDDEQA